MAARHVILLILAASALSACGRKPLQPATPYQAALEAREEARRNNEPLPPEPTPPPADKPFILDPLL
ncbi:MAG TPA: hypothetical protein VGN97_13930 [Mesorhizobium sp.]|jgi:uncharacterized lipoprotein|nr:hypothetical protein [Mesorhizobium sp.]